MAMRDQQTSLGPAYSSGARLELPGSDLSAWRRRVELLRTLPDLGHIEVWLEEPMPGEAMVAALRKLLEGTRVLLQGPYLQLSMISHHDLVRGAAAEVYRQTLALADALDAPLVTLRAGTLPFLLAENRALDQLAAMFAALRATGCRAEPLLWGGVDSIAAGSNLRWGRVLASPYPASLEELRRALERMPELRITLDVGTCVSGRQNWIAFLRSQAVRIAAIHLHDAEPGGAAELRLGMGAMDPFALARLLRALGFSGFVTLVTSEDEDTVASWQLWRQAQAEAAQETTATLEAVRKPG
ncbi:MAG: TIM barrel protein [Myxococcales bacterium]|nr:sugar phosphate isomerase/epimerase [Myxococcota bacterium]MDW8283676.1 TIM barrel protein [Myxococcales bacterium]